MKTYYSYPRVGPHEKCRNCEHSAEAHLNISGFERAKSIIAMWDVCDRAKYKLGCRCAGFEPADNLLYLEMLSEQLGK